MLASHLLSRSLTRTTHRRAFSTSSRRWQENQSNHQRSLEYEEVLRIMKESTEQTARQAEQTARQAEENTRIAKQTALFTEQNTRIAKQTAFFTGILAFTGIVGLAAFYFSNREDKRKSTMTLAKEAAEIAAKPFDPLTTARGTQHPRIVLQWEDTQLTSELGKTMERIMKRPDEGSHYLVVEGHSGAGKTTFVLESLRGRPNVLYITLRGSSKLSSADSDIKRCLLPNENIDPTVDGRMLLTSAIDKMAQNSKYRPVVIIDDMHVLREDPTHLTREAMGYAGELLNQAYSNNHANVIYLSSHQGFGYMLSQVSGHGGSRLKWTEFPRFSEQKLRKEALDKWKDNISPSAIDILLGITGPDLDTFIPSLTKLVEVSIDAQLDYAKELVANIEANTRNELLNMLKEADTAGHLEVTKKFLNTFSWGETRSLSGEQLKLALWLCEQNILAESNNNYSWYNKSLSIVWKKMK